MKILIPIIMISSVAFGFDYYMSKADIDAVRTKQGVATTSYAYQADCEKAEGEACYKINGKNLQYHAVSDFEVDDLDKPLWSPKEAVEQCYSQSDCRAKLEDKDCSSSGEGYQKFINQDYTELYCTKIVGYNKRIEKRLAEDPTLKAAYDAEQEHATQDADIKKQKKEQRKSDLKQCIKGMKGNSLNDNQFKKCVADMLREIGEGYLDSEDL